MASTVLLLLPSSTRIIGVTAPPTQLLEAHARDADYDCMNFSRSDKTIRITGNTTTFGQLAKNVNNDSGIKNLGNGEYLLSANIEVMGNSRLTIASPEVNWIKISNQGSPEQYHIVARGYMDIKEVKITSWAWEKSGNM